jgi:hypothetical protein
VIQPAELIPRPLVQKILGMQYRRTGIFPLERTFINSDYLVPAQVFRCLENIHGKEKKNEEEDDDDDDDETNHQEDDILVPGPIDHVSQLEVSENDIPGPAGDNSEETFIQEIRTPLPDMTTGTCFIQKIYVPSSSLLQGKYLSFSPSLICFNIFRLFEILSLTQLHSYTPEIFRFSTATFRNTYQAPLR